MSRKMMKNCKVIKEALDLGEGRPLSEKYNGKEYCQGYQKSEDDDEPYHKCKDCYLNIFYKK